MGKQFKDNLHSIITGVLVVIISGYLMSSASNRERIAILEGTTIKEVEVIQRLNRIENTIDDRLDSIEKTQDKILFILQTR